MSKDLKIGLVNFGTNSPYASIHKFCPTEDYMARLYEGKLKTLPYYSKSGAHNEKQEYNRISYEMVHYCDYFKKNINLNVVGYINQASNFYMVSKFLNNGLTFLVLNMGHIMNADSLLKEIENYVTVLKKNSPNSSYAIVLRYPDTSRWCFIATSTEEAKNAVFDKYPECKNVIIRPFSYTVEYETTYNTFLDIRETIEDFFEEEENFVVLAPEEQESLNTLLDDRTLSKKSVYTENTVRAVCSASGMNTESFMEKIVKSGFFTHFEGNPIGKYYFKNAAANDSILPVLLHLSEETTYVKRGYGSRIGRHFITNVRFRHVIPDSFKRKIMMSDRLILKILESLKAGRPTMKGNRLYLRVYDYDEFNSVKGICGRKPRFIYD